MSSSATSGRELGNSTVASPAPDSPAVSRAEVNGIFETWTNTAKSSSDSGIGEPTTYNSVGKQRVGGSRQQQQQATTKPAAAMQASIKSRNSVNSNGKTSPDLKMTNKLPRITPIPSRKQLLLSQSPPPIANYYQQPQSHMAEYGNNPLQRRPFVTVVRPYSYFPEPSLPPNFTPSVLNNANGVFVVQNSPNPGRTRPPSPAPFNNANNAGSRRQMGINNRVGGDHFGVAGQGVGVGPLSSALKVNLAGGSGWDLTAIRRGYDHPNVNNNGRNSNGSYKAMADNRLRYQSNNGLDHQEEKISMPRWNPYFGYNKVLSHQSLPLTDDWRRHIDARRKALQRRRARRRGLTDVGVAGMAASNGERQYNGSNQTEANFEELLRRPGDVESSVQTDAIMEESYKGKSVGGSGFVRERINSTGVQQENQLHNKVDGTTQVTPDELPEFESAMLPHIQQLVDHTMEQAFIEVLEEEELKEIKRKRIRHLEAKMAELTTSRLMNVPE